MNLFNIIASLFVLTALILVVRYVWGIFFDKNYFPVDWEHARKEGLISRDLLRLERNYPDKVRFFNWWFQVERLKRDGVSGDFAELGVYKGESAKIIHLMDPSRTFHLFDTFEGFKAEDLQHETGIAATYTPRHFADTSLEAVKRTIGDNANVIFHPGHFPGSLVVSRQSLLGEGEGKGEINTKDYRLKTNDQRLYALVNLDADLYLPTKAGLEYFYPRLSPGGVIVIHDYNHKWPGIKKAADEFAAGIPEPLVMVPDMEGSVMIVKSVISVSEQGPELRA